MRIMGLDVGTKTIGVAVSDLMGWTAQGVTTLQRSSLEKDADALGRLVKEYEVEKVIVGLPLSMDGTERNQAAFVRKYMESLKGKIPEIPLEFWDERLSTAGAERSLLEAELSWGKRRKVINKMAAVFILQGYLDGCAGMGGKGL